MLLAVTWVPTVGAQPERLELAEARETVDLWTARFEEASTGRDKVLAARQAIATAHQHGLASELSREVFLFLVDRAEEAVTSSAPCPIEYDSEGHGIHGRVSGALADWAAVNGLSTGEAARIALRDDPQDVAALVGSSDASALAIFQDAVASPNCVVVLVGARGFQVVDHSEAIGQIESVAYASPTDLALSLADVLDEFADPAAHTAADSVRAAQSP